MQNFINALFQNETLLCNTFPPWPQSASDWSDLWMNWLGWLDFHIAEAVVDTLGSVLVPSSDTKLQLVSYFPIHFVCFGKPYIQVVSLIVWNHTHITLEASWTCWLTRLIYPKGQRPHMCNFPPGYVYTLSEIRLISLGSDADFPSATLGKQFFVLLPDNKSSRNTWSV